MIDRLIELIRNAPRTDTVYGDIKLAEPVQTLQTIADHLLANGVIVPPMALGQICYVPRPYHPNDIDECRVSSITQKADGSFKIRLTNLRGKWVFEITPDKIGKTVFLTREEAEAALAEREGKG